MSIGPKRENYKLRNDIEVKELDTEAFRTPNGKADYVLTIGKGISNEIRLINVDAIADHHASIKLNQTGVRKCSPRELVQIKEVTRHSDVTIPTFQERSDVYKAAEEDIDLMYEESPKNVAMDVSESEPEPQPEPELARQKTDKWT